MPLVEIIPIKELESLKPSVIADDINAAKATIDKNILTIKTAAAQLNGAADTPNNVDKQLLSILKKEGLTELQTSVKVYYDQNVFLDDIHQVNDTFQSSSHIKPENRWKTKYRIQTAKVNFTHSMRGEVFPQPIKTNLISQTAPNLRVKNNIAENPEDIAVYTKKVGDKYVLQEGKYKEIIQKIWKQVFFAYEKIGIDSVLIIPAIGADDYLKCNEGFQLASESAVLARKIIFETFFEAIIKFNLKTQTQIILSLPDAAENMPSENYHVALAAQEKYKHRIPKGSINLVRTDCLKTLEIIKTNNKESVLLNSSSDQHIGGNWVSSDQSSLEEEIFRRSNAILITGNINIKQLKYLPMDPIKVIHHKVHKEVQVNGGYLIYSTQDVYEYPEDFSSSFESLEITPGAKKLLVFGDLHGNTINMIRQLMCRNVLKISKENFARLVTIYRKSVRDFSLEDFKKLSDEELRSCLRETDITRVRTIYKYATGGDYKEIEKLSIDDLVKMDIRNNLDFLDKKDLADLQRGAKKAKLPKETLDKIFVTEAEISEFRDIVLNKIKVVDNPPAIFFIGDDVSDGGQLDEYTMAFIEFMDVKRLEFYTDASNHGIKFIQAYEKGFKESWGQRGYQTNLSDRDDSLQNLGYLINEKKIINATEFTQKVEKHYLPHLIIVFGSVFENEFTTGTHTLVGDETIEALAKLFKVQYKEKTLQDRMEMINKINHKFMETMILKKCFHQYDSNRGEPANYPGIEFPISRILWYRKYLLELKRDPEFKQILEKRNKRIQEELENIKLHPELATGDDEKVIMKMPEARLPSESHGYKRRYLYGHTDGDLGIGLVDSSLKDYVFCLDNDFGKSVTNHRGISVAFCTQMSLKKGLKLEKYVPPTSTFAFLSNLLGKGNNSKPAPSGNTLTTTDGQTLKIVSSIPVKTSDNKSNPNPPKPLNETDNKQNQKLEVKLGKQEEKSVIVSDKDNKVRILLDDDTSAYNFIAAMTYSYEGVPFDDYELFPTIYHVDEGLNKAYIEFEPRIYQKYQGLIKDQLNSLGIHQIMDNRKLVAVNENKDKTDETEEQAKPTAAVLH